VEEDEGVEMGRGERRDGAGGREETGRVGSHFFWVGVVVGFVVARYWR
jgi:hypothetical protein